MADSNTQRLGALIPKHGGYRNLRSFQIAQLVYDLTLRFCDKYISKYSRTHDQMVQAARSGVQNIAEGSQASGTSKKTELKLTNVARASLEELKLDYEDYLRQNEYKLWPIDEPLRKALVHKRCINADEVAKWVQEVHDAKNLHNHTLQVSIPSISSISSISSPSTHYSEIAANAILVLIGVTTSLLDRQLKAQEQAFIKNGGFSEKLYKTRKQQLP